MSDSGLVGDSEYLDALDADDSLMPVPPEGTTEEDVRLAQDIGDWYKDLPVEDVSD